jgi:hypothetical protein
VVRRTEEGIIRRVPPENHGVSFGTLYETTLLYTYCTVHVVVRKYSKVLSYESTFVRKYSKVFYFRAKVRRYESTFESIRVPSKVRKYNVTRTRTCTRRATVQRAYERLLTYYEFSRTNFIYFNDVALGIVRSERFVQYTMPYMYVVVRLLV